MNNDMNTARIVLPEILDLAAAEGLRASLRQRVSEERPLGVDASAVETLMLPCVQVLLAAQSYRAGISIENPSAAFTSAFEDLGIDWTWSQDQRQQTIQAPEQMQNPAECIPLQAAGDGGPQDRSDDIDLQQSSENVMSKRILTIDDSKTMRDMLMLTLAEAGFDVLQAVDGQDGLDVLVNERVDVVITDINMPRMDGYEVIRQLRKNPNHKTTPILVLTTESEGDKRNLAREAGATGWMVKPFDPDRLVETVRKVAP
jgi:two-component system chemotaxis response regulator CheY